MVIFWRNRILSGNGKIGFQWLFEQNFNHCFFVNLIDILLASKELIKTHSHILFKGGVAYFVWGAVAFQLHSNGNT